MEQILDDPYYSTVPQSNYVTGDAMQFSDAVFTNSSSPFNQENGIRENAPTMVQENKSNLIPVDSPAADYSEQCYNAMLLDLPMIDWEQVALPNCMDEHFVLGSWPGEQVSEERPNSEDGEVRRKKTNDSGNEIGPNQSDSFQRIQLLPSPQPLPQPQPSAFTSCSPNPWTSNENEIFENAPTMVPENMPHLILDGSVAEVNEHDDELFLDIPMIDSEQIALLNEMDEYIVDGNIELAVDNKSGSFPPSSLQPQQALPCNGYSPSPECNVFDFAIEMNSNNSYHPSLMNANGFPYNFTPEVRDHCETQDNNVYSTVEMVPQNSYNQSHGTEGFFPYNFTSEVGNHHERQFSSSSSSSSSSSHPDDIIDPIMMLRDFFNQSSGTTNLIPDNSVELAQQNSENASMNERPKARNGRSWTKVEHTLFLIGLQRYGWGDWRNISRKVVITRTSTQIASHAQKFTLRQQLTPERRKRPSIHDITTIDYQLLAILPADQRSMILQPPVPVPAVPFASATQSLERPC